MKILVLGIGNDIKRDDAVGLIVARKIQDYLEGDIDVDEIVAGGLPVLNRIGGYDQVFITDSVVTSDGELGEWYSIPLDGLESSKDRIASHTMNLKTVKKIGKKIHGKMPEIKIFAIEVKNPFEFGKKLTDEMKEVLPQIISEVGLAVEKEIANKGKCKK